MTGTTAQGGILKTLNIDSINSKVDGALDSLFQKYLSKFDAPELREIVSRRYVYSKVDINSKVLIMGFNPSYPKNKNFADHRSYDFKNNEVKNYPYFKKLHALFKDYQKELQPGYLDLFYHRHSKQIKIKEFLNDEHGLLFLCEQLMITQQILESVTPRIIFLFNKQGANFLGKNKKSYPSNKGKNIWLGYDFEATEVSGLFTIKGFVNSDERINTQQTKTNLEGSYVYFSRFLPRDKDSEEMNRIRKDIKLIKKKLN